MEEGLENENSNMEWTPIYYTLHICQCPGKALSLMFLNTFIFMFLDVCCINWK